MKTKILCSLLILMLLSCKNENKKAETEEITTEEPIMEDVPEVKKIQVALEGKSGTNASGNAIFVEEGDSVSLTVMVNNLTEGQHAIHIHEKADCSADDGTSTGGHWNPTKQQHGKWGDEAGYHKGDIGNFMADANGDASLNFKTSEWCIGCGDPNKDIIGKAVIIHQGIDDYVTQPTGAAGGRVSCGGIIE